MTISRRSTLKALGTAGAVAAMSGSVLASGEYEDDEREPDDDDEVDEEPVDPAGAALRVAHFSPDAPNVDVFVDGDQVLSDLAYDEVSPYLEIDPGTYTVEVTAAGDPETVAFEGEVTFDEAFYTIAAIGELEADTFEPLVLVDAGAALVRLAHASPDAPAVDVVPESAEEPLFANVAFGDATSYVPVPVGSYTLEVRPADDVDEPDVDDDNDEDEPDADDVDDPDDEMEPDETEVDNDDNDDNDIDPDEEPTDVVATVDVDLEAGTAYSAYAIGYLEPPEETEDREFDVNVAVDGPLAPEEPVEEEPVEEEEEPVEEEEEEEEPVNEEDEPVTNDDEPVNENNAKNEKHEKEPADDKDDC